MKKAAVFGAVKDGKPNINELYLEHIHQCNVSTVIAYPYHPDELVKECDCLVVCGGKDTHPKFYGQEPYKENEIYDIKFDEYELSFINEFAKNRKPILGICRGMQSINIALGGTLIQDIPSMLGLCHSSTGNGICTHEIKVSPKSALYRAIGLRAVVNSFHHQCVHTLGKNLVISAASHDGIIEAIESTAMPIFGVQWHPERMSGNSVFEYFFEKFN